MPPLSPFKRLRSSLTTERCWQNLRSSKFTTCSAIPAARTSLASASTLRSARTIAAAAVPTFQSRALGSRWSHPALIRKYSSARSSLAPTDSTTTKTDATDALTTSPSITPLACLLPLLVSSRIPRRPEDSESLAPGGVKFLINLLSSENQAFINPIVSAKR